MIREGKTKGWLTLPTDALQPWITMQGSRLQNARFVAPASDEAKGAGVYATHSTAAGDDTDGPLLTVPRDLVLSKEAVEQHAKADVDLRAVLDSLGEFGQTTRIAVLTFLLAQSTLAAPSLPEPHFVHSPFCDYVKFLPLENLPTFWTESERELLVGTTLLPATSAKLNSLYREFDTFRSLTSELPWTNDIWWDEVDGLLSFDDWLQVDAMYRSRALEFPGIGDCMAPGIDMANHAVGASTSAIYEVDSNGDAILQLRDGISLSASDEITISYGDAKGPCEMLFSYGFLPSDPAQTLFLDLRLPSDDPQSASKHAIASTAPGIKLTFDPATGLQTDGDYISLLCANASDGLEFMISRSTDGTESLVAMLNDKELSSASDLRTALEGHPRRDVFRLREASVLQARVEEQLRALYGSDDAVEAARDVRPRVKELALKLRELEARVLEEAYAELERRVEELAKSEVVVEYLAEINAADAQEEAGEGEQEEEEEEDFS